MLKTSISAQPTFVSTRARLPGRQGGQSIRSIKFTSTAMLLFLAGKILLISLLIVADRLLLYLPLFSYLFLYLSAF